MPISSGESFESGLSAASLSALSFSMTPTTMQGFSALFCLTISNSMAFTVSPEVTVPTRELLICAAAVWSMFGWAFRTSCAVIPFAMIRSDFKFACWSR